jgi:hypothetical protein
MTPTIAGGDGTVVSPSGSGQWYDLPDDLLGNIRLRITSQRDRARLAAVCKSLRTALARIAAPVVWQDEASVRRWPR